MIEGGAVRQRRGTAILWGVAGLLAWLAAQTLAVGVAGGGHGWMAPFHVSAPLALLYPLTLVRVFWGRTGALTLEAGLIVVAAALDLFLLGNALFDEPAYVARVSDQGALALVAWLVLWATWQGLLIAAVVRKRRAREA